MDPGTFVALIGPSGCGKSTLLRLTAGLAMPSSGEVRVGGETVVRPSTRVGIMFQTPILLPWRTVLANVLLPVELLGQSTRGHEERARKLLRLAGLEGFVGRYPDELSGGMQQRVALARTLLNDPEILLLDEPFGALDALTREEMNIELGRIWDRQPKAALLVTHSVEEAVFLADQVVSMSGRPGMVRKVFPIPLPRPRTSEMKYTPEFAGLVRTIVAHLMAPGHGEGAPGAADAPRGG
ncbi:MAG: NitT/TauT family transport system ATP-binding protein [Chloroflexota bacterium]|nr:NitT/TauT family transport system ATP-binding protein [Chloroflexota bacterium]